MPEPSQLNSPAGLAWARLKANRVALAALIFLALLGLVALAAPWLSPHDFHTQFRGAEKQAPSLAAFSGKLYEAKTGEAAPVFPLGTDMLGRDICSRLLYGARVSLAAGLVATLISLLLGTTLGLISGYFGGVIDACVMRVADTFFAFPSVLLAVAIASVADKPGLGVVFLALGLAGWTGLARVVRAQTLSVKSLDYVSAARALGASHSRILFQHILPNCAGPIVIVATLALGGNILGEAGLSFLGLGAQEPYPSWGGMLADARESYREAWWLGVLPGMCIVATVLAFNLLGDGLRDALEPRRSQL